MADKYPAANGNWSDAANWNGGTKPTIGDDVYADGKTVVIDENINLGAGSIRTTQRSGGTNAGKFTCAINCTIVVGSVIGGGDVVITFSGASPLVLNLNVANITGPLTNYKQAISNTGTGTVNITVSGTISGGTAAYEGHAVQNSGTGTINITGNVIGGSAGYRCYGVRNVSTGTVNITGNVTGGPSGNTGVGAINEAGGTINISGIVTGGASTNNDAVGAYNNSTGIINITGTVYAGTKCDGVVNAAGGTVDVSGLAVGSDCGIGSASATVTFAITSVAASITSVTGIQFGSRGCSPIQGPVFFKTPLTGATTLIRDSSLNMITLVHPTVSNNPPAITDVRTGVAYTTGGLLVGTCNVPPANTVSTGVPVDNTVGTALLSVSDIWSAALPGAYTSGQAGYILGSDIPKVGDKVQVASNGIASGVLTSDALNEIAAAILDLSNGVETGYTVRETMRVFFAALAGKVSGANSTSVKFRDQADTKDRISATVDSYGNRSDITLDVS